MTLTVSDPKRERAMLTSTILASGMAFLSGAAVTVALPTIQTALGADVRAIQWVVSGYGLALAALILQGGAFGDRYGRKKIFLCGIVVFLVASVISGFAPSIAWLVAMQVIRGVGAAFMIPGSLAIINSSIAEFRRGRAFGLWAGWAAAIGTLGAFIGGWAVDTLGWRAIFFLPVPIGIAAFFFGMRAIPESFNPEAKKFDVVGTVLLIASLATTSAALIQAPTAGWGHPLVAGGIAAGIACLGAFIVYELRAAQPVVPVEMFRSMLVTGANLVTYLLYFSLYGFYFFMVYFLQHASGFSPTEVGIALLPPTILIAVCSGRMGTLADRVGPRTPMVLGTAMVAIGVGFTAFAGTDASYWLRIFPGLVLFGIGMAMVIPPLTKSALAVPEKMSGAASGVNNAVARTAEFMAIALLGSLLVSSFSANLAKRSAATTLPPTKASLIVAQASRGAAIAIPESFTPEETRVAGQLISDAYVESFRTIMLLLTALIAMASVVSAVTIRGSGTGRKAPSTDI